MTYTLITGACGGLGGAFARALAERGEPLFLSGRSEERLDAAKSALEAEFPNVRILTGVCDLTSGQSRAEFFARADEAGVRFNRLVYVAGVDTQMAFEDYSEEKLVFQTRVNFEGAVTFIHAFLKRALLDGKTEILVIGSMSGTCPMPYFAVYSATKRALLQFCIALRQELKGRAKVTCVTPGGIPTREDIKKDIEGHGFWGKVSAKSPRAVALASLKAVKQNKRQKIVGFWNRIIDFFTRIAPMGIKLRFIASRWKKTKKDAF